MRSFNLTFWIAIAPIRISSCLLLLESFFSEVVAVNKNSKEEKETPTRFYTKREHTVEGYKVHRRKASFPFS